MEAQKSNLASFGFDGARAAEPRMGHVGVDQPQASGARAPYGHAMREPAADSRFA